MIEQNGSCDQKMLLLKYKVYIILFLLCSYQQQPMSSPGSGIVSNCRGNKKALLIGINYYGQRGELRGSINDVNNIKRLITSRGFIEDSAHMRILTDDHRNATLHPTRRNIIEGMHWLGMHGFN